MEQRGRRESAARLAVEPSEAVQIGGAAAMQLRLPEPPPDGLSYAVFDFETTGLNPVLCNII
jgi:DNA polymerase III epsilon subunit-like protein